MTDATEQTRRKKLLHRARYRGFKEADILVGGFADEAIAGMSHEELDAFEALLSENDHDIYAWVMGTREAPPDIHAKLIAKMRAFDPVRRERRD